MVIPVVVMSAGVFDRAVRAAVNIETAGRPRRDTGVIPAEILPQTVGGCEGRQAL